MDASTTSRAANMAYLTSVAADARQNNVIEEKFQDTLQEVCALKRMLQELLAEPSLSHPEVDSHESPRRGYTERGQCDQHNYGDDGDESLGPEESAETVSSPQVRTSVGSERWLRRSVHFEPNFQSRMRYYMMRKEQRRAQIQQELDDKTLEELSLHPKINQRSRSLRRSISHLHAWNEDKELKLVELRQAQQNQEVADVAPAPRISQHSASLHRLRQDDIGRCKVEDRLHLLGLIYEYQQVERMLSAAEQVKRTAEPSSFVAPHSKHLVRSSSDSVHHRLFELAKKQQTSTSSNIAQDRKEHLAGRPAAVVDAAIQRLCECGQEYSRKREALAAQRELQIQHMMTATKLNAKSRTLARLARTKAEQNQESSHRSCSCCKQEEAVEVSKPCKLDAERATSMYDRSIRWKQQRDQRCQELQQRKEFLEDAELEFYNSHYHRAWNTFGTDADRNFDTATGKPRRCERNAAFFDRTVQWARDRAQQLERDRKKVEEDRLRPCTFRPLLSSLHRPKHGTSTVDQGYFSELSTPMLGIDSSDVSVDDVVEETSEGSESPSHRIAEEVISEGSDILVALLENRTCGQHLNIGR